MKIKIRDMTVYVKINFDDFNKQGGNYFVETKLLNRKKNRSSHLFLDDMF